MEREIKNHQHRWFFTFNVSKDVERYICKHCGARKYKEITALTGDLK